MRLLVIHMICNVKMGSQWDNRVGLPVSPLFPMPWHPIGAPPGVAGDAPCCRANKSGQVERCHFKRLKLPEKKAYLESIVVI